MKVVVFSSLAWSLVNFRGRLLQDLVAAGHRVIACAPDRDPAVVDRLAEMGVEFRRTPMNRAGTNPLADLWTLARYILLLVALRPDALIAYTQKPIIYGGLAARIARVPRYYVLMSGLGYVFSDEADRRPLLRRVVSRLYRAGVRRARAIFVFNDDDRRAMLAQRIIGPDHYVVQVPGSGVDIDHFAATPLPDLPPKFVMIARLMRDKGVGEFVEAARLVRGRRPDARFVLVGAPEPANPTGYSDADVRGWVEAGLIEHVPGTRDVRPYLRDAHVFVLPSFYREGLPRTILEALSSGRPVVTTDTPGCRDPITQGENGVIVPPRDAAALAAAMESIVADGDRLREMSVNARRTATERYDVAIVNGLLLGVMDLGSAAPVSPLRPKLA